MLLTFLQDAAGGTPNSPSTALAVAAAVFLSASAQLIISHLHGRSGKRNASVTDTAIRSCTASVNGLRDDLSDVAADVLALRTAMVGLDGQNGLRGDVRKTEERLDALEKRELDRLSVVQVGAYRPPV